MSKSEETYSEISESFDDQTVENLVFPSFEVEKPKDNISHIKIFQTPFMINFSINEKRIKYVGEDKKWTQILFDSVIPLNQKFVFTTKVLQIKEQWIRIGVVDKNRQMNERYTSVSSGNTVYYHGQSHNVCYGTGSKNQKKKEHFKYKPEGTGFKIGDTVKV